MFKKIVFLLFLLLLTGTAAAYVSDYGKTLSFAESTFTPATVHAGDIVSLNVAFENKSYKTVLEDLNVVMSPGLNFEAVDTYELMDVLGPKEVQTFVLKFKVKKTTPPGDYKIPLKVLFSKGPTFPEDVYTEDFNVSLMVTGLSSLNLKDIALSKIAPHLGDNVIITATLVNNGTQEARNPTVVLSPVPSASFGNVQPTSETTLKLDSLGRGEEKQVSFSLFFNEEVAPGVYEYKLDANSFDLKQLETEKISLHVRGQPVLIISGTDVSVEARATDDEKKILVGDSFSVSIQVDNIGEEKAKAVELFLDVDDGLEGMKKVFVGNIDEDDSGAAIFNLVASPNAKLGEHNAILTIKYLDELNQEQEIVKTLPIFINQPPAESPIGILVLILLILVALYFVVKQVIRYLQTRSRKK